MHFAIDRRFSAFLLFKYITGVNALPPLPSPGGEGFGMSPFLVSAVQNREESAITHIEIHRSRTVAPAGKARYNPGIQIHIA